MLFTAVIFLIVIGFLIIVHEFGHFSAAKLAGIRVERFSVGFGRKVVSKKKGDTEYTVAAVPLGGYVKLAGHDLEEFTGAPDEFYSKSIPARLAVILAGPVFNVVSAFLIYCGIIYVTGLGIVGGTTVGDVEIGSPAYEAGFEVNDRILAVNGVEVDDWNAIWEEMIDKPSQPKQYVVERNGRELALTTAAAVSSIEGSWDVGLRPKIETRVGDVKRGGPADRAGIRSGDRIVEVGGVEVDDWDIMGDLISARPGEPTEIAWDRDAKRHMAVVTPEPRTVETSAGSLIEVGKIDISPSGGRKRVGFLRSVTLGASSVGFTAALIIEYIPKLITRQVPRETLGGPIRIGQMAGESARWGLDSLLVLVAYLSITLAIFNALPIPLLDGGHIVLLVVEGILRRRPTKQQQIVWQFIGMMLILPLILFILVNDIQFLVS
jgi:regulator of sigma E protease